MQSAKTSLRFFSTSNSSTHLQQLIKRTATSLPIIDIAALVDPSSSSTSKQQVGAQLDQAIRDYGFFYIKEHNVPDSITNGVLSQARKWFNLPLELKQQIALRPERTHYRGYQQLGANVTRYETSDGSTGGFSRDWHEGIDLYKEITPSEIAALERQSPIHGMNPWPVQLPEFEAVLREYIDACLVLGRQLMRGIAVGLSLPEETFEGDKAGDSYWVTRVIYYPPLEESDLFANASHTAAAAGQSVDRSVQLSCGEHTDYGLLTIVNQEEEVAALQVKDAHGKWITAEPIPGTFVCNIGDMLKVWTNNRYLPTEHRVVNAAGGKSRVSIPFFYEPNFEAVIEPMPQLCSPEKPPMFKKIVYGDHLESKVLRNFELEGIQHDIAA